MNLTAALASAPAGTVLCYPGTDILMEAGDWVVQGDENDADFGEVLADGSIRFEIGGACQDLYVTEGDSTVIWVTRERAETDCMARRANS